MVGGVDTNGSIPTQAPHRTSLIRNGPTVLSMISNCLDSWAVELHKMVQPRIPLGYDAKFNIPRLHDRLDLDDHFIKLTVVNHTCCLGPGKLKA